MFFWGTTSGVEVDFVLEDRAGKVVGVEVKASAILGSQDARGLRELADTVGKNWLRGIVLFTGKEVVPFASNLHGIPLNSLWA